MAREWTKEQKKVIELHNRNILVSAAAGSGKTAVLVERIISMVTDPERNIDIDKLVVVTFTKAAAGEMRARISAAIEEKLENNPENEKLQKQLTLIHNAQITTIDSFCLNIVRNNFTSADIDPGFRTADEGELKLLEADVMGKILEEYYDSDRKDYFDFVDSYGTGKSDVAIEELIHRVYNFSRSYPWPLIWLEECQKSYEIDSESMLNDNVAVVYMTEYVKKIFLDYDTKYVRLEEICKEPDGPDMYLPMIASDHANIAQMLQMNSFEEMGRFVRSIGFETLSRKKGTDVDADKKAYVKYNRDLYKDAVKNLQNKVFRQTMEQNFEDIRINTSSIKMLIELAMRFYEDMKIAKKDRNIIDFNDMEHLALDILVKLEDGKRVYSDVADRLSSFYEEILIDEYQDSNMLQEEILKSISKGRIDESMNNMFMVGDVKQSIYKFRLARPDIFIGKYNEYSDDDSLRQKIELRKNFRSRDNVLMSINDVFFNIMKDYFGGIEYNENVMLNTGLEFPEPEMADSFRIGGRTEVIIINSKPEDKAQGDEDTESATTEEIDTSSEESEDDQEIIERELEAEEIAVRISQLTDPENGQKIYDHKTGGYRTAEYKDIVILTRTVSGWADTFVNVLMNRGIPAFSDSSSGYFNTREITLVLSLLTVIDNPIQDIPLAAVLTSYFGNITTQELADIRKTDKKSRLYKAVTEYTQNGTDTEIIRKLERFMNKLDEYRKAAIYTDIHDLIWQLIYDTGFYDYAGTMPAGVKRQANLDMLIEKAKSYEGTSYRGLFNFLRYIEKLKKYDVDYGEATILGENENLVRIMSIHKSKGLEFPVVILAGMSKRFNNMDAASNVVIDAELGIGANAVNLENRTKSPTIIKNAVGLKIKLDNLCEEMRILYVALTRAKEKLIMTGTVKNIEKTYDRWLGRSLSLEEDNMPYSFADLESSSTYFDLVVPTALKKSGNKGQFDVKVMNIPDIIKQTKILFDEKRSEVTEKDVAGDTSEKDLTGDTSENGKTQENRTGEYLYPYRNAASLKGKMTVSELKKLQHEPEEAEAFLDEPEIYVVQSEAVGVENDAIVDEEPAIVPKFISGEQKLLGADRGTAYHRVMECFNYEYAGSVDRVKECLKELRDHQKITEEQLAVIDPEKIYAFCASTLGKRIMMASGNSLKREQQFVYEPANKPIGYGADDMLLIQGVIDLYFEEEGRLIIVDYKTDRVPKGDSGKNILTDRYKLQLDYYADALMQLTGVEVGEKVIWSFDRDDAILL